VFNKNKVSYGIANRSHVGICDRPVKNCLTSSLINVQNLVVVSHTVCSHVGGPKNSGYAGAPPLKMGVWLTPWKQTTLPYMLSYQISLL